MKMAFMMPVVKKDYEIYKSRRTSETNNPMKGPNRKISEGSRPTSLSVSAKDHTDSPAHRSLMHVNGNSKRHHLPVSNTKTMSRMSHSSLPSPSKAKVCSPPPKSNSASSLSVFHYKLVDKLKKSFKKDSSPTSSSNGSVNSGMSSASNSAARKRS